LLIDWLVLWACVVAWCKSVASRLLAQPHQPHVRKVHLAAFQRADVDLKVLESFANDTKVAGLKDDLSYALATTEIRILAPIPGKQAIGIEVGHPSAILAFGDVRLGLTHGHLEDELAGLLAAKVDFLLHGHSHEMRDERIGATRILNPGALHRAARFTAMLLDPRSGEASWIDVSSGETVRP